MKYVALLRGINVGGNKKVSMDALKTVFENIGMREVSTYINSGNVIFDAPLRSTATLASEIEQAIESTFGFTTYVLVRTKDELIATAEALPPTWRNDSEMKCDVMFLWEDVDEPAVVEQLPARPEIDTLKYIPGAVMWSIRRSDATKSGMVKIIGTPIYKRMTIRNCNTVRKLAERLMT